MEPQVLIHPDRGWIEVVCGSMFSGKTEELIRRLKRARIAKQSVEIFKPALDTRFGEDKVVSHDETAVASTVVHSADQIQLMVGDVRVVGIDEAQFFGLQLVSVCESLARKGCRVIVAGLDQDYRGLPFEPIPQLMAVAEYVTKLHAICVVCGAPANHSQRIVLDEGRVLLGAKEAYEPRCRACFVPPDLTELDTTPDEAKETPTNGQVDPAPASEEVIDAPTLEPTEVDETVVAEDAVPE